MTFSKLNPMLLTFLVGITLFFAACDKDKNPNGTNGQLNVEITDGPTDDTNVKSVFITVAEVRVDGETFSGFSGKKTIDLMAYQEGNVALLGLGDLEAGSYQNITLVLDVQTDANGNAPGCYVQTVDNVKHVLSTSASQTITTTNNFTVTSGSKTNVVLDFDLRKAVMYQSGVTADHFDFVGSADLQAALRLVVKSEAAHMTGTCQNAIINTEKLVAYVYEKGQFNRELEIQAESGIAFKNAVASTEVNSDGTFKVAYLENGNYEVHFAAYNDLDSDGKLEFQGTLILDSLLDLGNLQITSNNNLLLNITVIGILP